MAPSPRNRGRPTGEAATPVPVPVPVTPRRAPAAPTTVPGRSSQGDSRAHAVPYRPLRRHGSTDRGDARETLRPTGSAPSLPPPHRRDAAGERTGQGHRRDGGRASGARPPPARAASTRRKDKRKVGVTDGLRACVQEPGSLPFQRAKVVRVSSAGQGYRRGDPSGPPLPLRSFKGLR